ncbi:MAG: GNAT family N-acetyltransferase, partial [Acetatifactor sp.]|nr:GNAT family N-acetyltransferase [Acetatifactor sp.]
MIQYITDFDKHSSFIDSFSNDPEFSDPMLEANEQAVEQLKKTAAKPNRQAIGVFREQDLTGFFLFLIIKEENYIEMLTGLSKEAQAYREMFRYLQEHFPRYRADFVLNPANKWLRSGLEERGAGFEKEQNKMVYQHCAPQVDTIGVEELTSKYEKQYLAIHRDTGYWTGEKILEAPERFRSLIALEQDRVVGYVDVTYCYDENEPFDLFVPEDCRRKGYGRKLLAKALMMNEPGD